ncbi:MAG: HDOD domain-containing protein, partial [Rhodocyclaceae bacterium]|nr:HDOD domain-containing protein [Rhodocyclaceae bacterium]
MDNMDAFRLIAARTEKGDLTFPTNASVTLRVQRALDDPDCHIDKAAKLVSADPLLSARVVAVANAIAFNSSGKTITDVRLAVNRLGFRTVKSLAAAQLMRLMGSGAAMPSVYRDMATKMWEHTSHVAALAQVIAKRVAHVDPETAFFSGVIHEVGAFWLLSCAKEYPGLLETGMAEWENEGQALVGRAVLKVLAVPDSVVEAIEAYWAGYLALPPNTMGGTLLLADRLSPVESPFRQLVNESREGNTAHIDAMIGDVTMTSILEEAANEVASLT